MTVFYDYAAVCLFGLVACALVCVPVLFVIHIRWRPGNSRLVTALRVLFSAGFRSKVAKAWHTETRLLQGGGLLAEHEKNMPLASPRITACDWQLSSASSTQKLCFATSPPRLALCVGIYLFVCALASYSFFGAPGTKVQNSITRSAEIAANSRVMQKTVDSLQARLAEDGLNAQHWRKLGETLLKLAHYDLSVEALRKAISLGENNSDTHANLGEALTLEAEGAVTAEAQRHFEQALRRNRRNIPAIYYLGLARLQHHKPETAMGLWLHITKLVEPDNAWGLLANDRIAETAALNGLDTNSIKAVDPARAARGFR